MYIVPTAGLYSQVGFTTTDNLPTDAVSTGFTWFGSSVAYVGSDSDYELLFSAVATNESEVYALYWNGAGSTVPDGSFPVTLKSTPPTVLSLVDTV